MSPFVRLLSIASLLLAAGQASARALDYRIDAVHTQILFSVDHDGYSHPVGRLHVKSGWLRFDEDDWSTARVVADIDLSSADMGDKDWNEAVAGRKFLDAEKYPTAHFESTSVEQGATDGHGAQTGTLHGKLILHGVTHKVAIPFTVNRVGATLFGLHTIAGFSGHTTLDRMQFGMTEFPKAIGQQVDVRLELEAILDSDAQKKYAAGKGRDDAAAQH